jgi:hypothetical protein
MVMVVSLANICNSVVTDDSGKTETLLCASALVDTELLSALGVTLSSKNE